MISNRENLLQTVGRNIVRVNIGDLVEFGLPETILESDGDKYQLRILKSSDTIGQATLQGVVVRDASGVSPLRTREIVSLGGSSMGFVEGTHAYGTFGAWHKNTVDLGIDGIVETTSVNRDNALFMWRVPSDDVADATMLSPLSLGGHNITNVKYFDIKWAGFNEGLSALKLVSNNIIFQNRTTLDNVFETKTATVSGTMSADSRSMEIAGSLLLADLGKFSSVTAENLWVNNLTLSGLSVESEGEIASLRVNQALDMTSGYITAMFVTVGFSGSITPRLTVSQKIEDSTNPAFYWDVASKVANLYDVSFAELTRMAPMIAKQEKNTSSTAWQIFSAVSANKNATLSDYMIAIEKIQKSVREKYRLLNLE